jgi:hypothetical protein
MAVRFRKRIGLGSLVKVNVSRSGKSAPLPSTTPPLWKSPKR